MKKNRKKNNKMIKKVLILFVLIFIIYALVNFFNSKITPNNTSDNNLVENTPKDTTIHISAIGDIMCHSPNYKAAYDSSSNTYYFSPFFTEISQYTSSADITIGNLETTFAGESRGYSGYPNFNSPASLGNAIHDIGVDVLCTANNHSLDKGFSGLSNTLDTLDNIGISHMGTYRSSEEQESVLIKNVNGINIAFLAFTYGINGAEIPSGKNFCINLIDENLILKQLESAKKQNADIICVNMHWGIEYQKVPNSEQKRLANFLFENGVDIILGSHPHVLQPMEQNTITLSDGTTKDTFVIYSLGNFCSSQKDIGTNDTVILDIQVTKSGKTNKISIDSVNYTPVFCYDKGSGSKNRYQLIDLKKTLSEYNSGLIQLNTNSYNNFQNALQRIEKIYEIN